MRLLGIILAFSALAISTVSGFASTKIVESPANSQIKILQNSKTHMLSMNCPIDDGGYYLSRITVLDIPPKLSSNGQDIALITGHAIDNDTRCIVMDFRGNTRKVAKVRLATNYKSGTKTDWGLVYFKKLKGKSIIRFPLKSENLDVYLREKEPVQFAAARGLPTNTQYCTLSEIEINEHISTRKIGIITHDCHAIAGQSGTPITKYKEGQDSLLGIHLGHIWMFKSPLTGRPDRLGYIRPFDDALVEEIRELLKND